MAYFFSIEKKLLRFPGKRMIISRSLILAVIMGFMGLESPAFGQTPMTAIEWAAFSTERLTAALSLSEEQVEKVKALNLKVFNRTEQVRAAQAESKTKMARMVRRILQDRGNELKKALKPDQWRRLQVTRLEQSIGFRTEMISLVLNLNAAQTARVGEINENAFRKVQEAQREFLGNKLKMIEAVRTLQEEREKELAEVLAPDQWKIYQEIQREIPDIFHRKIKEPRKGEESARPSANPSGRPLTASMERS